MNAAPLAIPSLPYATVSIGTLIGRAWNLFRANMRASILLMLLPGALDAIAGITLAAPSSVPVSARGAASFVGLMLTCYAAGFGLIVLNAFLRAFFLSALSRLYMADIEGRSRLRVGQALLAIWLRAPGWAAACVCLGGLTLGLILFDWIVLFLGVILLSVTLGGAAAMFLSQWGPFGVIITVVLMLVIGVALGAGVGVIIGFQGLCCLMPLTSVANTSETGIRAQLRAMMEGFGLMWRAPLRTGAFGLALMLTYSALSLTMSLPAQIPYFWMIYMNPGAQVVIPLPMSVALNLYGMVVSAIIWPFIFAALTLFWYDCRVRARGVDMALRLERLTEGLVGYNKSGAAPESDESKSGAG